MKPLASLVDLLLMRAQSDWQVKLRSEWPTIMGDLTKRTRLERIHDSTVVLGVYDSHWIHELHAMSWMIVQRINQALSSTFPAGFKITAIHCIWVYQQKKDKKKVLIEQKVHAASAIKPPLHALQSIQKIGSADLQQALLAYYMRCNRG